MTSPPAGIRIRPATDTDHVAVRELNAANVPEVGPLDDDRLSLFAGHAEAFWVAADDRPPRDGAPPHRLVGLFVGLCEGHDYASPNYRWFAERHERFAYVDRVALLPPARGTGLADTLYDRWEQLARDRSAHVLCAEVNTEPPNPRSLAFHRRRGFTVVDEQSPYGGSERVALLERDLRSE